MCVKMMALYYIYDATFNRAVANTLAPSLNVEKKKEKRFDMFCIFLGPVNDKFKLFIKDESFSIFRPFTILICPQHWIWLS